MILWLSYLNNGIPYTGKISLYLISAQGIQRYDQNVSPKITYIVCAMLCFVVI